MKLYITDNTDIEVSIDTTVIGSTEFNSVQSHPYIRTAGFSVVLVDITNNKIKFPYVQGVMQFASVVPYYSGGEISEFGISILCELYKDRAAELRYYSFVDMNKFEEIVLKLKEDYQWELYY